MGSGGPRKTGSPRDSLATRVENASSPCTHPRQGTHASERETIDEIKGTLEAAENLAALYAEWEKAEETTSPYQHQASASRAAVLAHKRYNNQLSSAAKLKKQWCVVCDQIVQVSVPQVTEQFVGV